MCQMSQVVVSCLVHFNLKFFFYVRILFAHLVCKVVKIDELMVVQCANFSTVFTVGWFVDFGCGWAKLIELQKQWLVCQLGALLILLSVGILSIVFSTVFFSWEGCHSITGNVLRLRVRADFGATTFPFDKSMLGEGTFQA